MTLYKKQALERVAIRARFYQQAQDQVVDEREDLAKAMVEAKELGATQQEIADVTADHEDERLSRQRVKQLIDEFREQA